YQHMVLRDEAAARYGRALEVETTGGWKAEIRARQSDQASPLTPHQKEAEIVAAFHASFDKGDSDAARKGIDQHGEVMVKHAFSGCCKDFLKYSIEGDQDKASSSLAKLNLIGEQFAATRSDESVKDIATYLTALSLDERKRELELINDYFIAYSLINQRKFSE